jgi:hypothetical protein
MARSTDLDGRDPGWRELVWAATGAAAVTVLLVISVGIIWVVGRTPTSVPALQAQPSPTPTPRALAFVRHTPTPPPPVETPTPTAVVLAETSEPVAADEVATPDLAVVAVEEEVTATEPPAEPVVVLDAPAEVDFPSLASGSWTASAEVLSNPGASAVAEPWLRLVTVPSADFAVEAEIRVNGLLDSVCDQSFGLTGGSAGAGAVYGGGVLFPCGEAKPRARITDVSVWEDGYNADPVTVEDTFDPENDWHTYRFEVRGDELRLVIDGDDVISGTAGTPLDTSQTEAKAGLWAQGTALDVRRVAVYSLPDE